MSYHVTILRTKNSACVPIHFEEVQAAVSLLGAWEYVQEDHAFVKKDGDENTCVVWYDNGELWAKTPSQWGLEQMIALAIPLQARVRGDEFETYETIDKWYRHPDDVQLNKEAKIAGKTLLKKHRKEQQVIRLVIISFFVILGAIAYLVGKSFEK